jgi:hypothetical protein
VDTKQNCGHKSSEKMLNLWTQNVIVDTKVTRNICGHKSEKECIFVDTKQNCGHKSDVFGVHLWTQNRIVDTKNAQKWLKTVENGCFLTKMFGLQNLYFY